MARPGEYLSFDDILGKKNEKKNDSMQNEQTVSISNNPSRQRLGEDGGEARVWFRASGSQPKDHAEKVLAKALDCFTSRYCHYNAKYFMFYTK